MAAGDRPTSTYWVVRCPYMGTALLCNGFRGASPHHSADGFGTLLFGSRLRPKTTRRSGPGLATAFVALSVLLLLACVQCSMGHDST